MGVLRRVLPLAVLVFIAAGCASSTGNIGDSAAPMDDNMQSVDLSSTDLNTETASIPNNEVIERQQIAAAESAGIELALEQGSDFSRVLIDTLSEQPVVDVLSMNNPPRLVVDLLGEKGRSNGSYEIASSPYVERIRLGTHKNRIRVVFDLTELGSNAEIVDHQVDTASGQIQVAFLEKSAALPEPLTPATTTPATTQIAEEEDLALPASTEIAAAEPAQIQVQDLALAENNSNGHDVIVSLNSQSAFDLQRTAPTEYTMTIPAATAFEATTYPRIAPKTSTGIRTARAVEQDGSVQIRMFVEEGFELRAQPNAQTNSIKIAAIKTGALGSANDTAARAQLAEEEENGLEEPESKPAGEGIIASDSSKVYTGRLISLDLQDTDIDNALRIIAEVSNLNIIASDEVTGKVTLRLIDVPWDQALDVILKTNGLDQVREGNVIRIAPVEKLRAEREALLEAKRAAQNLEELTVRYLRVSYARVSEMQEQVEGVLTERGSITIDERTNQLIVKDVRAGHEAVTELVSRLDLRTPQVLLETQIVEAQRNILRDLGFQWNYQYSASPATGNATGFNFPNSVNIDGAASDNEGGTQLVNFPAAIAADAGAAIGIDLDSADGSRALSARLSALETEGRVRVVSRPQVATVNNKEAQIKSVETVRVRLPDSGLSVATGSGASAQGGGSSAFEEIDIGIELRVTPQASPDYYVLLDMYAKSSTFGSNVVDNIPSTIEREATSTILVKSGQTFALGGVYRLEDLDQVQGVPFLKDVPFLGALFRRSLVDKQDEELIFFITPHIVEGSFDPSLM